MGMEPRFKGILRKDAEIDRKRQRVLRLETDAKIDIHRWSKKGKSGSRCSTSK